MLPAPKPDPLYRVFCSSQQSGSTNLPPGEGAGFKSITDRSNKEQDTQGKETIGPRSAAPETSKPPQIVAFVNAELSKYQAAQTFQPKPRAGETKPWDLKTRAGSLQRQPQVQFPPGRDRFLGTRLIILRNVPHRVYLDWKPGVLLLLELPFCSRAARRADFAQRCESGTESTLHKRKRRTGISDPQRQGHKPQPTLNPSARFAASLHKPAAAATRGRRSGGSGAGRGGRSAGPAGLQPSSIAPRP